MGFKHVTPAEIGVAINKNNIMYINKNNIINHHRKKPREIKGTEQLQYIVKTNQHHKICTTNF